MHRTRARLVQLDPQEKLAQTVAKAMMVKRERQARTAQHHQCPPARTVLADFAHRDPKDHPDHQDRPDQSDQLELPETSEHPVNLERLELPDSPAHQDQLAPMESPVSRDHPALPVQAVAREPQDPKDHPAHLDPRDPTDLKDQKETTARVEPKANLDLQVHPERMASQDQLDSLDLQDPQVPTPSTALAQNEQVALSLPRHNPITDPFSRRAVKLMALFIDFLKLLPSLSSPKCRFQNLALI